MLANLQGGKVSDLNLFGQTFTVSMGAIMYSGIYFATDLISEKYGRSEANTAVILGAIIKHCNYVYSSFKHLLSSF